MSTPLPPDPYKILGVAKNAALPDIRSAHRKLVLKCHPDKVQDAALKAIKQDEFQKVQQAYELLSDDTRRTQYDEQQKLFELRKEMGRSGPVPGKNVFDYEIRTAEPRSTTFKAKPKETTRVYTQPSPRSYEDDLGSRIYEEPLKARARKTASYEERKRPSTREEEKRKKAEEEREHERWEKEARRTTHSAAKKGREKDRKKDSESKHSRAFVVDASDSDEPYRPRPEKKSSRRSDDELRAREAREELTRAAEKLRKEDQLQTERTRKLHAHKDFAAQYMQAARRKAEPEPEFRPAPMRRAETFQEPPYTARYTQPPPKPFIEEEDLPRRSAARRTSEHAIPVRSRDQPRSTERSSSRKEPFIVDATPSAPQIKIPSLQTHSSAPPMMPPRKEPHRSKTMDYSRNPAAAPPPLPRASTFQSGDRNKPASRGSKLKKTVEYSSDESDSDVPYNSPRATTPPPRRRDPSPVRYVIEKGRSIPLNNRHRSELREDNYSKSRDRSESPLGGTRRSTERPPIVRSSGSGAHQSFSRPAFYKGSTSPEPIIKEVRPKMPPRESSRSASNRGPYFGEVKYAPNYGPEHVSYTATDPYRRGSDPTHHRDYGYPPRPSAYA